MRAAAPDVTLVAKSNAGMPELVDMRAVYRADPPTMAEAGLAFQAAGARIIGACCGSTPAHLKAMAEALGASVAERAVARRLRSASRGDSQRASAGTRTSARRRTTGGRRG